MAVIDSWIRFKEASLNAAWFGSERLPTILSLPTEILVLIRQALFEEALWDTNPIRETFETYAVLLSQQLGTGVKRSPYHAWDCPSLKGNQNNRPVRNDCAMDERKGPNALPFPVPRADDQRLRQEFDSMITDHEYLQDLEVFGSKIEETKKVVKRTLDHYGLSLAFASEEPPWDWMIGFPWKFSDDLVNQRVVKTVHRDRHHPSFGDLGTASITTDPNELDQRCLLIDTEDGFRGDQIEEWALRLRCFAKRLSLCPKMPMKLFEQGRANERERFKPRWCLTLMLDNGIKDCTRLEEAVEYLEARLQ